VLFVNLPVCAVILAGAARLLPAERHRARPASLDIPPPSWPPPACCCWSTHWCGRRSRAGPAPARSASSPPRLLFRFFRTVVTPNLGRVGKDLQAMEEELAASGLDWHALRPVKLTDGPLTRNVQVSDRLTMKAISRADVAWHILALAEDRAASRSRTPVISTGASRKSRPAGTGNRDLSARQSTTAR